MAHWLQIASRMVLRATLPAAVLAALLLAPRPARACSPPYNPHYDDPPCTFVNLYVPADAFPRQLERAIRIGTFDSVADVLSPQPTFDPDVQVFVHRLVGGAYQPVAFTLVDEPGLVPNAKHIQLADPVPGQYIVSSPQMTCPAESSPAGMGLLVGRFELEAEAPLPGALGVLRSRGVESVDRTYDVGVDGECRPVVVDVTQAEATFELQLAPQALPWSRVLDAAIYVDGASYIGFSRLAVSEQGLATVELARVCSTSDATNVPLTAGPGPGTHSITVVARIDGLAEIESTPATFALACEDGWSVGGCAAGGGVRGGTVLLALVVLVSSAGSGPRRRPVRAHPSGIRSLGS